MPNNKNTIKKEELREYSCLEPSQKQWVDILFLASEEQILSALKTKILSCGNAFNPLLAFNPYPRGWGFSELSVASSLMNIAASRGHINVLKFLENELDKYKNNINQNDAPDELAPPYLITHHFLSNNPMLYAIRSGQKEIVDYLIKKEPIFSESNQDSTKILKGREIYFEAVKQRDYGLLADLIEKQWFDPNYTSKSLRLNYFGYFLEKLSSRPIQDYEETQKIILYFIKKLIPVRI